MTLPSEISRGTIVKNSLDNIGKAIDEDDIIEEDTIIYQRIYKEVFTGTGGIGRLHSVYPASYQTYENKPTH